MYVNVWHSLPELPKADFHVYLQGLFSLQRLVSLLLLRHQQRPYCLSGGQRPLQQCTINEGQSTFYRFASPIGMRNSACSVVTSTFALHQGSDRPISHKPYAFRSLLKMAAPTKERSMRAADNDNFRQSTSHISKSGAWHLCPRLQRQATDYERDLMSHIAGTDRGHITVAGFVHTLSHPWSRLSGPSLSLHLL